MSFAFSLVLEIGLELLRENPFCKHETFKQ